MGRSERREQVRTELLSATRELLAEGGVGAVTVRAVASRIGYTLPVLYQHFADKNDLLFVVLTDGFTTLAASMRNAAALSAPADAILAAGRAYLDFAAAEPRVYELMHGTGGPAVDPALRQQAAAVVVSAASEVIARWAGTANVPETGEADRCETCWALLHGMATISAIPEIGPARAWALTADALHALMDRWARNSR